MAGSQSNGERPLLSHQIVFEAAPDALLVVDAEGVVRDANEQAVSLLGYGREAMLGMRVERFVPEASREAHVRQRTAYMDQPRARPMGIGMELRALRADGRKVPVEISLSPCSTPEGRFVIVAIRDVSERKRLRQLGAGTLRAAEEERRRIARELHDDTAQCLAALLVRLRVLRRTGDPDARERLLDEMHDELADAVEGVRRISQGLRPPALEDVGIEAAIRSHVRGHLTRSDLDVDLAMEGVQDLTDEEGQLVIYRVVQEAMTNVVRHADARSARIQIRRDGDDIRVSVRDDGRGFDADGLFLQERGLGLLGMDERARLAGGHLEVRSAPGEGTEVELVVPVRQREEAARG